MKKSLCAIIVLALSLIGANAIAAKLDINVKGSVVAAKDTVSSDNEKTGGACRSKITK